MQSDVRALLEPAQVDHTDNEGGYAKDALMQDTKDEGANVKGGAVMHGLREDSVQVRLVVVVLHLEEQSKHLVTLHPLQDIWIRPDMPMKEMDSSAQ
jgi:hypothetical protein